MAERLDALLAHAGLGTRKEVRGIIRSGRVTVAGEACRDQGRHAEVAAVSVDGVPLAIRATEATLLLHKPLGVACSHDEREAPLVDGLVPESLRHLALNPAGRLDRDTSGLLVLTTDGPLIHALTNPRRHVSKRYRIAYRGRLSAHAVERCARGILLDDDDRPTRPARLELEGEDADGSLLATLHLAEGRYHQVRRMIAACGGEVVRLHRDRIGSLELPDDLEPGAMRPLREDEAESLLREPADGLLTV